MRIAETKSTAKLVRQNLHLVKGLYPGLVQQDFQTLRSLTRTLHLCVLKGEILYIEGKWYVTHAGLLQIAMRRRCLGIRTALQEKVSDLNACRWVFKATVYKSRDSRGFVGYGDADPSNVSIVVNGAEMRVAETRAVNRALRKAYGIGLCSVEELGCSSRPSQSSSVPVNESQHHTRNDSTNGQPRLRDQLCLLIRQYNLDANLVKAYAADFCGTEALHGASRELVESFISHLSSSAKEDIDGLICKLNSYSRPAEVNQ